MKIRRMVSLLCGVLVIALLNHWMNSGHTPTHSDSNKQPFIQSSFEKKTPHHAPSSQSHTVWQRRLHLHSNQHTDHRQLAHVVPLADQFPFKPDFRFPQPKLMKPVRDIDRTHWIHELRQYLNGYNLTIPISLVTSNTKYTDVLLNWLISATVRSGIPLESILILSLDHSLHYLLLNKGLRSILVPTAGIFDKDVKFSSDFERVMMLRLSVMRIINHFGADVIMYDTDAVILKDPQPLYDTLSGNDIIGSVGKIPLDLATEWGITICIGVVLVKSSEKTEIYWNSMHNICQDSVDDQEKLNCGLKALDIRWLNNGSSQWNTTVCGVTWRNKLSVCIVPYYDICRQWACEPLLRGRYYVWHKGGQRNRRDKMASAKEGNTWFLRQKWDQIGTDGYSGVQWLNSITYLSVVHS